MEAAHPKYPDLFNIVFFKVRAKLVKMGKISKVTGWPKMKQTGIFSEYLGNQLSDFQIVLFSWKLRPIGKFWV